MHRSLRVARALHRSCHRRRSSKPAAPVRAGHGFGRSTDEQGEASSGEQAPRQHPHGGVAAQPGRHQGPRSRQRDARAGRQAGRGGVLRDPAPGHAPGPPREPYGLSQRPAAAALGGVPPGRERDPRDDAVQGARPLLRRRRGHRHQSARGPGADPRRQGHPRPHAQAGRQRQHRSADRRPRGLVRRLRHRRRA